MKSAIVDIDNTLWQFCDAFFIELRKINKDLPAIEKWNQWDIWEGYCTEQEFLSAVDAVHEKQDSDDFRPYPEAEGFLTGLRQNGFFITIASHRSPQFMPQTVRWLKKNRLIYDDLHLSHEKTRLFTAETYVVVDDSPQVLEKAVEKGALATGLLFPWNRAYSNNGFRLCSDLKEVLSGILDNGSQKDAKRD